MNTVDKPQQIIIKNAKVMWAHLVKPTQAFDEGQPDLWSVNMYVNAEEHRKLVALGCTAKLDKEGQDYFIAKRNTVNKKKEQVQPPAMVDAHKRPFADEVGNGSVCNIAVTPFAWSKGAKSGVILYLNAVQVIHHVPRSQGVDAFDAVDVPEGAANDDMPF